MIDAPHWIEFAVIGAYLAVLLGVGFAVRKLNSNVSDYFRNGCKGTWWLVGASSFMQIFSAWTFTGAAGAAFEAGWSVLVIFASNTLCFLLVFLFLGPWFRQLRAITAPEVIRLRFGPGTQQFYAWLQSVLGLLYAALWLLGLATFVASVFDFSGVTGAINNYTTLDLIPVQLVIIVAGAIVLTYSVAGGSWAVMATDFIQSLVLIPLTLLVAFLCIRHVGGFDAMFGEIEAQGLADEFRVINDKDDFKLGQYGWAWASAFVIYKAVSFSTLTTAQKYFGVKDGNEARKAGLFAAVLMAGGMLVWFVPPVVARLTMGDAVMANELSKPEESAYATIAVALLPTGMVGLMVVAMLSATMSSMDSGLNRNAAVVVRDIEPLFQKMLGYHELSAKARFILAQIVSFVLGLCIIGLALYFSAQDGRGVFEGMLDIGSLLALPLAVPLFLALFIRWVPNWSAIAAVVAVLPTSAIAYFAGDIADDSFLLNVPILGDLLVNEWPYHQKIFVNLSIGIAAFCATIPFWSAATTSYRKQVSEFYRRMHTPVDFKAEVGEANDAVQLKTIGLFSLAIGLFISLIAFVPGHDTADLVSILAVAAAVAGVGGLLVYSGRRGAKPTVSSEPPTEQRDATP